MLGTKVYGFKFDTHENLQFSSLMERYIGQVGVVIYYSPEMKICRVRFEDGGEWLYPSEHIGSYIVKNREVNSSFDINIENVIKWARDKDLLKMVNAPKQMLKVVEEVGETASALLKKDDRALIDGIGDSFVTLIILAKQMGLDPAECLDVAWHEIKDRDGKLVDGTFIKF